MIRTDVRKDIEGELEVVERWWMRRIEIDFGMMLHCTGSGFRRQS